MSSFLQPDPAQLEALKQPYFWPENTLVYRCSNPKHLRGGQLRPREFIHVAGSLSCPSCGQTEHLEIIADLSGLERVEPEKAGFRQSDTGKTPNASLADSKPQYGAVCEPITVGIKKAKLRGTESITTWAISADGMQWHLGPIQADGSVKARSYPGHRETIQRDIQRFGVELTEEGNRFIASLPDDYRQTQGGTQ